MYRHADERVEALRWARRMQGVPTSDDIEGTFEFLGGGLVWDRVAGLSSCRYRRLSDGRGNLETPPRLSSWELRRQGVHELGHHLLDAGEGACFWEPDPSRRRVHWLREGKDEWRAEAFTAAFLLPSRLVQECDDGELLEESGCPLEMIRERRRRLAGEVIRLYTVPEWSAYWAYRVRWRRGDLGAFRLEPLFPDGLMFELQVPDRLYRVVRQQIHRELVCLTADEFALKYLGQSEVVEAGLSVEELLADLNAATAPPFKVRPRYRF